MIHLKTLPGYPQHLNMDGIIRQAVSDAHILEEGGVNALLLENTIGILNLFAADNMVSCKSTSYALSIATILLQFQFGSVAAKSVPWKVDFAPQ